jgi:mannose-6-phosphate isomerase-like protein (cupin superfamily)
MQGLLGRTMLGRMRSLTALPPALAVAIAVGCGREPRTAPPLAPETPPSTAAPMGTAPAAPASGDGDAGRDPSGSSALAAASSAGAPAPPAPIDGSLFAPERLALSTKASCPAKTCRLEGSLLEAILGSPENRAPAAIWEEDLGAGAAVSFARHADMDVLGIVLSGSITLLGDESKGSGTELAPWNAFVAPGSGIGLRAKGGAARLVVILVTAGEGLAAKVAANQAKPWTSRPAPIASSDLTAAPDLSWGKGAYHARIAFGAEASPRASLGILKMSADGGVAPHVHEKEWELMAVLQGQGDFIQGVGEGENTVHAADGVLFSVPPGTRHQWKSAGSRPFLGIQVYAPPGPEQRFKKLAAGL